MWRDSILNNATQHGTTIFKWTLVAGLSFRHRQPWHKSRTHRRQTGTSDELQLLNFKRVGCCEPSPVWQPSSPPVGSHLAQPSRRVQNLDATLSRTGRTEHNNSTILWYYASLDNWLHMIAYGCICAGLDFVNFCSISPQSTKGIAPNRRTSVRLPWPQNPFISFTARSKRLNWRSVKRPK